jgi:murein DD-endopeptidase MepM/ murein hydrolase activator NlpD
MKQREKNQYYTFMLLPHDASGRSFSLRIPAFVIRYLLVFFLVSFSIISFSVLYSVFLSGKLVHYTSVVHSSNQKDQQIKQFAEDTFVIRQELQSILDENNTLRKALGLKVVKTKIDLGKKYDKISLSELGVKPDEIKNILADSKNEINDNKTSLQEVKQRYEYLVSRLSSAPTAWPLYGRIVSYFGYRRRPWKGFHTGVDISAGYGAPVRSTAAGVVSFTGWRQGYGRTVMIDHGYGFSTLYAHNSKIRVSAGQKVKRGQLIASVGNTGYSTGPHCHYEVRKGGAPVNPIAYLGMNVLTASRYF